MVHGPRQIAATSFAGVEECLRERHGLGLNPQRIKVDEAARQEQSIEFLRFGLIERNVDPELVTPFSEFPRADAFGLRRDDLALRASFIECLPRPLQLNLFETVRHQDRDFESFQKSRSS